jgi:hypothetical protein
MRTGLALFAALMLPRRKPEPIEDDDADDTAAPVLMHA